MLDKKLIIEKLESLGEHEMAKDIFVPVLKAMGCGGVKFTGGADERGVDVEYFELSQPEGQRRYVGVQFKKGRLTYSSAGKNNSVKQVRNQAEEAFEKEIHDIDSHATLYISRFVVAVTRGVNEEARSFIGQARQKGADRNITYWTGDRLAKYIQDHWMDEFSSYFEIEKTQELKQDETNVVDHEQSVNNETNLVRRAKKDQARFSKASVQQQIDEAVGEGQLGANDLLESASKALTLEVGERLNVSGDWRVVDVDSAGIATVVRGAHRGRTPLGAHDSSWTCSRCYSAGPWNGNRCMSCGNFEAPD